MLIKAAAETNVVMYLMIAVGVLGVMAKLINHITLNKLVKAAGNMPKSTNKLIKLVRAKYEHACMIHGTVGNVDAFVEKYIYEYRGILFRIHTWRQIEWMSVWGSGLLSVTGALAVYLYHGFNESVYQYIASGAAEMTLLSVLIRMSDEPYKIHALKMYMTDYLENICAFRLKRMRSSERDTIDVITRDSRSGVGSLAAESAGETGQGIESERGKKEKRRSIFQRSGRNSEYDAESGEIVFTDWEQVREEQGGRQMPDRSSGANQDSFSDPSDSVPSGSSAGQDLPINIEGEPRTVQSQANRRYDSGNAYRYDERQGAVNEYRQGSDPGAYYQQDPQMQRAEKQAEHYQRSGNTIRDQQEKSSYRQKNDREDESKPNLKEETIRQILEEFLA